LAVTFGRLPIPKLTKTVQSWIGKHYIFTFIVNYQNIYLLKLRSKKLGKEVNKNTIPFWAQPTSKFKFPSTEEQKIKEETTEESLCLGKKVSAPKPIPKLNLGFRYRNQVSVA
jgi:hypothetical protein